MADPLTCDIRAIAASDGTDLPVPVGGLGLPDGGSVIIAKDAAGKTTVNRDDQGNVVCYYVAINNNTDPESEGAKLIGELNVETALTRLDQMATEAFSQAPSIAFKAAGLTAGGSCSFSPFRT